MIGLLLVPSEVCMNKELGEILLTIGLAERDSCNDINIGNCDFADCTNCPLTANNGRKYSNDYYVAQIGKVNHELRYSNSSGTDVQPEPRETSN